MLKFIHCNEGLRLFRRALHVRNYGIRRYHGNAEQICEQIVKGCWNGTFFQASTGHFNQFWTRDFGWCTESLLKLGNKEKVTKTLGYALHTFQKYRKITTTISPKGVPFDFPAYAVDSVPFIIHSLYLANAESLIGRYKEFLNKEIHRFYWLVINEKTGLVKNEHFSSMKDHAIRFSSCYDNSMVAMLNRDLQNLPSLDNPLIKYNFEQKLIEYFWRHDHFIDDLSGNHVISGDANIFPFWTEVITSKDMLKKAIRTIQKCELDKPFPLRYYHSKVIMQKMHPVEIFAKGYERDTAWMHMGPLYVKLVQRVNKKLAQMYLATYTQLIERYKNYLEVFNADGTPFKSIFYQADEGMLWAVNYLGLKKDG